MTIEKRTEGSKLILLNVRDGQLSMQTGWAGQGDLKDHRFELSDVDGPAVILSAHHGASIAGGSSCDFPEEDGAPPEFVFKKHWDNIINRAKALR